MGTAVTVATVVIGLLAAGSIDRRLGARAYADEIKASMVGSYQGSSAWRAHVEERELVGETTYRTTRYRLAVGGPEHYRVETIELDEEGREVVSVTLRNGTTVFSSTRTEDGPARVLEIRNVPPTLGAMTDNLLGQRIRELARARQMRYEGRDTIRGKTALRLTVEPGHLAWVDNESSVPVREQFLSGDTVTHEIEYLFFEADTRLEPAEFDPAKLGGAPWMIEDLGFRTTPLAEAPTSLLGFAPRPIVVPAEWQLLTSGYIEPGVHPDSGADVPVWVAHYATPGGPVLVSQSHARGISSLDHGSGDGTDGPILTEVAGYTVAYYTDEWRTHATLRVDDVLVSLEGMLPADELLALVGRVR